MQNAQGPIVGKTSKRQERLNWPAQLSGVAR